MSFSACIYGCLPVNMNFFLSTIPTMLDVSLQYCIIKAANYQPFIKQKRVACCCNCIA